MKKRFFICAILFLGVVSLFGQGRHCLAEIKYRQAVIDNPVLMQEREERRALLDTAIKKSSAGKNSTLVTLPIVFHVIYNTNEQNIDSLQIASQIDVLNEDFRKLNSNTNILQGGFVDLAADSEIEFKLATTDPNGVATNGITRAFNTNPAIGGSDTDYYDQTKGGVPAWDPERYINVWVVNINSAGGDFGFATFPGDADPAESDGAVVDFKYIGTTGTATNSQPQHLGRTLTHELGHYFGLFHIWGDVDDCSSDDDISDTPLQETSTDGCLTYPHYDLCTITGDGINFNNYMDYTDDECMAMFTEDQKTKIRAVLSMPYAQGGRSELMNLFSSVKWPEIFDLRVYPNPTDGNMFLEISDQSLFGEDLRLYSVDGSLILSRIITSPQEQLNLSGYAKGIYFLQLISDGKIWRKKIVYIQ